MGKKNYLLCSVLSAILTISFVSCDKEGDPTSEPNITNKTTGVYILSQGSWKGNNSTLDFYNPETKELNQKVFSSMNGRSLGDTANDMLIYGSKMYIAVSTSATIEVTDITGKSLKTITPKDASGFSQEPRMLEGYNGKVYVTLYDGYLACIDTVSLEIEKKVKVGIGPEGVRAYENKLYVASSGGWSTKDSSLYIVDPISFTVTKDIINVVLNPFSMHKDSEGDLYIISKGDYGDIKNTLQRMDKITKKVDPICLASAITIQNDKIYGFYNDGTGANVKFIKYDAKKDEPLVEDFITDGTVVKNPFAISSDPVSGNVYIFTSDYKNTGDVYVFSSEGKLIHQFGTSGINPMGAFFVTSK
ncbi:MAG: YncE family protein [Macellibacteroides fermentans]|uniref:YncE family protein n=1 Tax=Macellibacteroides fermentans TaxID=879969 RepID=UPI003AD75870